MERTADRQLAAAILGMGRPPYVLDPRQMGKTNLLLHAIRRLGSDDLRFVYLDLSVRVASPTDFYRRILDRAAASHPDLFGWPISEAFGRTVSQGTESSAAFQALLVDLLTKWPGRLAIVLDEVDGLTGLPFSDSVFAFVRSVFFMRETLLPLARLTFVLAGVAEPARLIRDKSISPFNIGQKIFLRDFSPAQVAELADRASLPFDAAVIDRIVHWSSGNPRLTWEIASELDQMDAAGEALDAAAVDAAVERLFLISYDRPPVDHIRTLVENDHALRLAVGALRRSEELSDAQRTALYLAGIATQTPIDVQPAFRSLIVDRAVTDRWLNELEQSASHLLGSAMTAFRAKRYDVAVEEYAAYFAGRPPTATDRADLVRFGIAKLETGMAEGALETFMAAAALAPLDAGLLSMTAQAKLVLGRRDEAESDFRAILAIPDAGRAKVNALIGIARIAAADPARSIEARSLALDAVAEIDALPEGARGDLTPRDRRGAFELAGLLADGPDGDALLRRAVDVAGAPPSLAALANLVDRQPGAAAADLSRLVDVFTASAGADLSPAQLGPGGGAIRRRLGAAAFDEAVETLSRNAGIPRDAVVARVFEGLVPGDLSGDALEIGREAIDRVEDAGLARHIGRTLILGGWDFDAHLAASYLDAVARNGGPPTRNDYLALVSIGAGASRDGEDGLNARLLATAERMSKPADPLLRQSFLLVRYVQILAATRSRNYELAKALSADARLLVDEIRAAPDPDLPTAVVDGIVDFLDQLPSVSPPRTPARNAWRHLGRNDVVTVEYRDGTRTTGKFKALMQDLTQGACMVVEVETRSG